MITKELFIELINTIQEQAKAEERFCNAFSEYANSGEYPPIISNRLLTPLFKLLEETIDPSGIIEWWLYDIDDGNKFVYENVGDDEIEYNLNDITDLYESIAGNFSAVKSSLDCEDLIKITGLGRDNVRNLLRSKSFPTTKVGKRQDVSVLNFVTWLTLNNNQSEV